MWKIWVLKSRRREPCCHSSFLSFLSSIFFSPSSPKHCVQTRCLVSHRSRYLPVALTSPTLDAACCRQEWVSMVTVPRRRGLYAREKCWCQGESLCTHQQWCSLYLGFILMVSSDKRACLFTVCVCLKSIQNRFKLVKPPRGGVLGPSFRPCWAITEVSHLSIHPSISISLRQSRSGRIRPSCCSIVLWRPHDTAWPSRPRLGR